jgi:hypothetical protein
MCQAFIATVWPPRVQNQMKYTPSTTNRNSIMPTRPCSAWRCCVTSENSQPATISTPNSSRPSYSDGRQPPGQAGRPGHGWRGAEAAAVAWGPRCGNSVWLFTWSGLAAILGWPGFWCAGGSARRVISVVVAPGLA